jgi:hypothetical protein
MTFEQCHANLLRIRRHQGTRCPAVRVAYHGMVFQGRLTRADSDPEYRRRTDSPFGVIVLENLGLGRAPETILQIADIPEDGIADLARS